MTDSPAPAAPVTLLWLRDDLRVEDHEALTAARQDGTVAALWIREERDEDGLGPRPLGGAARWWAHRSLEVLEQELAELNIPLLFAAGHAAQILPEVALGLGAQTVRWQRRYAPRSRELDAQLKTALQADGIEAHSHAGALLVEPWEVSTGAGAHYKVFTPFWRAATEIPVGTPLPSPTAQQPCDTLSASVQRLLRAGVTSSLADLELLDGTGSAAEDGRPVPQWWRTTVAEHWTPGCVAAQEQLDSLADAVDGYRESRDLPGDEHSTSRLSPRLRFGELSPRQLVHAAQAAQAVGEISGEDRSAWVRQVYWREFAWHLTYHCPPLDEQPLRPEFRLFPWTPDPESLAAWQRGRTGIALVDAGMRELWQTGWMHNRVRMVVASLLAKNLLHPWWDGEQWFWDTLVDADEANNPVSWQWVAGCGADAAPYFRVFNPETQRAKFDPDGTYVQRWVPEALEPLIGYPEPIVDLKESRQHALDAYAEMKARADTLTQ